MFRNRKRAIIVAGVAVVALAAAIGGYAYWSTTGTGTAAGTAGTTSVLLLHGSFPTGIYPGGSETVTFTADNSNPGSVQVGTISLTGVTFDTPHAGCLAADFSMAPVVVNQEIAHGTTQPIGPTGTLQMADTTANQDACKGATITLALASS